MRTGRFHNSAWKLTVCVRHKMPTDFTTKSIRKLWINIETIFIILHAYLILKMGPLDKGVVNCRGLCQVIHVQAARVGLVSHHLTNTTK